MIPYLYRASSLQKVLALQKASILARASSLQRISFSHRASYLKALLSTEESEGPSRPDTDNSGYSQDAPGSKKDPSCQAGQRALIVLT